MLRHLALLGPLAFFCAPHAAHAQGCSDAGVCTAGPLGPMPSPTDSTGQEPEFRHSARLTFSYAVGEEGVVIGQAIPRLDLGISNRLSIQLMAPWVRASGDLGQNAGPGDLTVVLTGKTVLNKHVPFTTSIGVKVPANNAAAVNDTALLYAPPGATLPMPYQTSLGTYDLLLGAMFRFRRWNVALAYQHVLRHANENGFTPDEWSGHPPALGYFASNRLRRANDAVLRSRFVLRRGRFAFQPGLLAIYHLGEDERPVPPDPAHKGIAGSRGLTLNVTADAAYRFAAHWTVELAYGSPVVVREARPDGLTRHYVVNTALVYRFGR